MGGDRYTDWKMIDFVLGMDRLEKELQETKAQLEKYEENSIFLGFLEECGVDNWDGYSEAWKLTKQYFKEKQRSEK